MKTKTFVILAGWLFAAVAGAQEIDVQLATETPPHYVGVGAVVQLTVKGLDADPEPTCTVQVSAPEIRARLAGISPRIMQRMFQSGNQIRRIEEVTHIVQFRVSASKPGEYEVGPFEISQNGTKKRVDAINMSFLDVPTTDDMKINLVMPPTAYPDQRVPVEIQWWYAGDTETVKQLTIRASLFDQFQFDPDARPRGGSRIPIQTNQGAISLPATAREETVDGKRFTVVSAKRTMVPSRPGMHEIEPITATIEKVTRWDNRRRSPFGIGGSLFEDAFGGRRAAAVELFRAAGEPRTFQVLPFPNENRPGSFSGAIGKGFSLSVAADRTVVRVGEPIRLTLDLRGDGNVEGAALPSLSADGGLDPDRFLLPDGEAAGVFDGDQGTKRFVVSVRVLEEGINEIPAIAYSWFDAERETYQTTRSKPIALRVMPAQRVGAESVVSGRPSKASIDQTDQANQAASLTENGSGSLSLSGADLAIERDPRRLRVGSHGLLSNRSFQFAGYALGSVFLVAAIVDRRRRQVDPAIRKSSAILRQQRNRIIASATLEEKEAARQIADALQIALAEFPNTSRIAIEKIMSECDAIAYKPKDDQQATVPRDLVDRAVVAIDELKSFSESA